MHAVSTRALTWLIFAIAVAASVVTFILVDSGSHSGSDTLYGWVPSGALIVAAACIAAVGVRRRS